MSDDIYGRYVIMRRGYYVADMRKSGTGASYTPGLANAKVYKARAAAQANCCDDETIVDVSLTSLAQYNKGY